MPIRNNIFVTLELLPEVDISQIRTSLEKLALSQASFFRFPSHLRALSFEELHQFVRSRIDLKTASNTRQVRANLEALSMESFESSEELYFKFLVIDDVANSRKVVAAVFHPSISDADSEAVFVEVFFQFLTSEKSRSASNMKLPWGDSCDLRSNDAGASDCERSTAFWRSALKSIPVPLRLPTDRIGLVNNSAIEGGLIEVKLEGYVVRSTSDLSPGGPLFIELLSLYLLLLARYSGESTLAVEVFHPIVEYSKRSKIIDSLTNHIALGADFGNVSTFEELKKHVQAQWKLTADHCNTAYYHNFSVSDNQSKPKRLNVAFSSSTPFDVTKLPLATTQFDSLKLLDHDLLLNVIERSGSVFLQLHYDVNQFDETTAKRITDHLLLLASKTSDDPGNNIYNYDFLSNEERLTQLKDWNRTDSKYPEDQNIDECFDQQAQTQMDSVAVICGDSMLSYGELLRRSNLLAAHLSKRGLLSNEFVAIYMNRSIEMAISMLAVMKAGAAYLPLTPGDSENVVSSRLHESRAKFVLTGQQHENNLFHEGMTLVDVTESSIYSSSSHQLAPSVNKKLKETSSTGKATKAFLVYTSGSTNVAKGVVGLHRSMTNRVYWGQSRFPILESDVVGQRTGLNYVDHTVEIFSSLITGARLLIIDQDSEEDIRQTIKYMDRHCVSRITVLPSVLNKIIDNVEASELKELRFVFCSGDMLTAMMAAKFYRKFSRCRLVNMYGATETGADSTYYEVNPADYFYVGDYFKNAKNSIVDIQRGSSESVDPSKLFSRNSMITQPNVSLGDLKRKFVDTTLKNSPLPHDEYLDVLQRDVYPYLVNVSSQRYIGHMTSALPSFVGDLSKSIAELNQNMVKIETSKVLTLVERQVLATLHRLFYGLDEDSYQHTVQDPDHVFGVVTNGGSTANVTALLCARNNGLIRRGASKSDITRLGAHEVVKRLGLNSSVIIVSRLAHYSIRKTANLMGLGTDNILVLDQTEDQRVCLDSLNSTLKLCHQEAKFVIAVIGIAGATETGVIDPLTEMAKITQENDIHFHVDAAWGGAFVFSDTYAHKLRGIECADTITFCAHKQLYTPQGLSVCMFKDTSTAHGGSVHAAYQGKRGSYDMGQYAIEGSRPANSLLLHATFNLLGKTGIASLIDQNMEKTKQFVELIERSEEFELVGQPQVNIINYRFIPRELRGSGVLLRGLEENQRISEAVAEIQQKQFLNGKTFVSKTEIVNRNYSEQGITVFRVVLSNPLTRFEDLSEVIDDQIEIAAKLFDEKKTLSKLDRRRPTKTLEDYKVDYRKFGVPIGRPIANTRVVIVDEKINLLPIGVIGEICISGDSLSGGYLNDKTVGKSAFVPSPFFPESTMYRTGDLGRFRVDGNIELVGRIDHQVKIDGTRIELSEIEWHVMQLDGISDCLIVLNHAVDQARILTVYVVVDSEIESEESIHFPQALQIELSDVLPTNLIPVEFELVKQIPYMKSGKYQRFLRV